MRVTPLLTSFNLWLSEESPHATPPIILRGDKPSAVEHLVVDLAAYLNGRVTGGSGQWLAASSRLVEEICLCSEPRRLLGLAGEPPHPPLAHDGMRDMLVALGRRGRVIFQDHSSGGDDFGLQNAFRVWIAGSPPTAGNHHLALDPTEIGNDNLPRVIGEAFVDWLHQEDRAG